MLLISEISRCYGDHSQEYVKIICKRNGKKEIEFENDLDMSKVIVKEYPLSFDTINFFENNTTDRKSQKKRGNNIEKIIINKLRKENYVVFDLQKKVSCRGIKGNIDGKIIIDNKYMILEIKSRNGHSHPTKINIYDMVQIQLYMHLEKKNKGLLIIEKDNNLHCKMITFNKELVDKVLEDCSLFA